MLPRYIQDAINGGATSIGDAPFFPGKGGEFLTTVLSRRYETLKSEVSDTLADKIDRLVDRCDELEKPVVRELQKICGDTVKEFFSLNADDADFECTLGNYHPDEGDIRLVPDSDEDYEYDSIEDMDAMSREVMKRRMCNILCEGAATYYATRIDSHLTALYHLNPDLPALYKRIDDTNMLLAFEGNQEGEHDDAGHSMVYIGTGDARSKVKAYGSIFPALLHESLKGFFELAAAAGLPDDRRRAEHVMAKADFAKAEYWDSILGYPLWEKVEEAISKGTMTIRECGANYLMAQIASLSPYDFASYMKEVFAGTKKGVALTEELCRQALETREDDDAMRYMAEKRKESRFTDSMLTYYEDAALFEKDFSYLINRQ